MLIAIIPIVVALAGLLMFALCTNPKLSQIGFALFQVGALWAVYAASGRTVRLL